MFEGASEDMQVLIFSNCEYIDDTDEGVKSSVKETINKEPLSCYDRLILKGKTPAEQQINSDRKNYF